MAKRRGRGMERVRVSRKRVGRCAGAWERLGMTRGAGEVRWRTNNVRVTRARFSNPEYSGFQFGYSGYALTRIFRIKIRTFQKLT